jgi:hypothetical protein
MFYYIESLKIDFTKINLNSEQGNYLYLVSYILFY